VVTRDVPPFSMVAGNPARVVRTRSTLRTLDYLPEIPGTEQDRIAHFGELFRNAVALRMRSDVPIGTCLSGGFDSSAVICAMSAHEKDGMGPRDSAAWRHAFVASFPQASQDERPMAEEAAARAGVTPTILEIGPRDALVDLDRILADNDDIYISSPSAAWLVYRELRKHKVLVSLDGHGADELMGAYLGEGGGGGFFLRNVLATFNSRAGRHAVDMARADWRLVTYAMALADDSKLADGQTKMIARRAMQGRMPESIRTGRRKVGFNSPMPEWLNGPLSSWIEALLTKDVPAFAELVDETRRRSKIARLTAAKAWDWEVSARIWPYLNMKWAMAGT
jgi:asparagine synthetase B (glutamine-hydrolysing)